MNKNQLNFRIQLTSENQLGFLRKIGNQLKKEPIKKNQLGFSRKPKNQLNLIRALKGGVINYNPPVQYCYIVKAIRLARAHVKTIVICRHTCCVNRPAGIEVIFTSESFLHPKLFLPPDFFTFDFLRPLFFTTTIFLPSSLYFDPTETLVRAFH